MKNVSILLLAGLIILIWGCGDQNNSPVISDKENPVAVEMPDEVNKILDTYDFNNQNGKTGTVFSLPYEIINGTYDSEWDIYAVTFLWGQFFGYPTNVASTTDWTGDLAVNGVADIKVIHKIDFEDNQDYLVDNDIPSKSEWVSITNGDFDGLSFLIMIKKGIEYFAPLYLAFETEPFKLQLSIDQLRMFKGFYLVDNNNAVAVFSRKIWQNHCASGLMEGKWIKEDNSGQSGRLEGVWFNNAKDTPEGIFVGRFWVDENGNRLLEGSVSGYITDQVIAFFKGRWYYDDPSLCPICGSGHGAFSGKFEFQDRDGWGYLGGVFGWPNDVTDKELPLKGYWKQNCPTISDIKPWD